MKLLPWFTLFLFLLSAQSGFSQQVEVIKLPALQQIFSSTSDTTYIVNFWATWCKPCVEELPHFEQIHTQYAKGKVKVILVSLDFVSKLEDRVKPLVQKKGLKSAVWLLNEPDQNAWISQVDSTWSGAIPFTLLINGQKHIRKTFEKELTLLELTHEIKAVLP